MTGQAPLLFPSAPLTGRRNVADDEIGGYRIPAGSDVILSPWVTHRHPSYWDAAAEFGVSERRPIPTPGLTS